MTMPVVRARSMFSISSCRFGNDSLHLVDCDSVHNSILTVAPFAKRIQAGSELLFVLESAIGYVVTMTSLGSIGGVDLP